MTSSSTKTIEPKELRKAFGTFMTGVTVVTTIDSAGTPIGFTANSFTSVSLDPPLLLVCPAKSLSSFEVFNNCRHFQVNILAHNQEAISNIFASSQEDRFAQIDWTPDQHGSPKITGVLASFSCSREQSIDAGDHIVMLGKVVDFEVNGGQGLGYGDGGYFNLDMERKATELQTHTDSKQVVAGALVEHNGKLLLVKSSSAKGSELCLPQIELEDDQPSFDIVKQYLTNTLGVAVNVGRVFSIFDHENSNKSSIYYRVSLDHDLPDSFTSGWFHTLDEVAALSFTSRATNVMIERYISERKSGNHGLYIGTDATGTTHKITGA